MKTKLNKNNKLSNHNKYRLALAIVGLIAIIAWSLWFSFDSVFVTKGADITETLISGELAWDKKWFDISKNSAIVATALMGVFMMMQIAYLVIKGRDARNDVKNNVYELIVHFASVIAIMICTIKVAQMMINDKFIMDLKVDSDFNVTFTLYHLDFLKFMSVGFVMTLFGSITVLLAFRKFSINSIIKDINILIIVFAGIGLILYVPFVCFAVCRNELIDLAPYFDKPIDLDGFWNHITAQCITMPIGVLAGCIMVLMFLRVIVIAFMTKEKIKKSHLIIFCIIGTFVTGVFIACHVNKLEIDKVLTNEIIPGTIGLVSAEVFTCVAAAIYTSLSMKRLAKVAIK